METGKYTMLDKTSMIKSATDALELLVKYRSEIEPRLKPDEIGTFKAQINELSGTKEPYRREKSRTPEETSGDLHECIESIRNLVKNNYAPDEILKAYGVEETIPDLVTAGRKIVKAYSQYTGWSRNEAGILKSDMDELIQMIHELSGEKETSGTVQINKEEDLQQVVLREIARISALGAHVFKKKDPAAAAVFEKLIPSGSEHEMAEAEITG